LAVFFYNIFLWLFRAGTQIASLFNPKAKKWVTGRKQLFQRLEAAIPAEIPVIWVHCASLGEFEQGRPVMEKLKALYPGYKILLTFFSPSGYEVQKNYKGADWVFYLPMDSPRNAKRFLEIVHPSLVIFVKYEFWYYYLKKIKYRNIPLLLISALFRKDMSFFKWYGGLQRKMLSRFDHLFVQTPSAKKLVDELGLGKICSISGDTRFDRVLEIAAGATTILSIEKFIGTNKAIIAGSTWKPDEELLQQSLDFLSFNQIKLIIAPHEIDEKHISELLTLFPTAIRYSTLSELKESEGANILIIDNIGLLSRIYRYAYCCYIGGGLSSTGVHNVLEAAVFSKPVFYGPQYTKYSEAIGLIDTKGAYAVENKDEFIETLNQLLLNPVHYEETSVRAGEFVKNNAGATQKIVAFIQEKRLLTS
jgi:3-deoxy-D-manno-octulosonic-acid transferase